MLGNASWKRCARAFAGAWILAPLACAHGIEVDFDPGGEGGSFTGAGGSAGAGGNGTVFTVTSGTGGAGVTSAGSTVTGTGGSTGEGGSGGASGSGVGGGATGGAAGSASGAGGVGGSGAGGTTSGAAGSAAGSGGASMGGAGGAGGRDAGAAGGGTAGAKVDAGVDSGPMCPAGVAVTGTNPTLGHGARDPTDVLYTDTCPQEQVVIGYTGFVDTRLPASVGRIQTLCGTLSASATGICQVTATTGAMLPMRGTIGTAMFTLACPANQVVVSFQGRSSVVVDQIGFTCAPLTVSRAANGYQLALGATTALPRAGGTGGVAFTEPCPAGQIARGTNVTVYSGIVGAFGLICGTPSLR